MPPDQPQDPEPIIRRREKPYRRETFWQMHGQTLAGIFCLMAVMGASILFWAWAKDRPADGAVYAECFGRTVADVRERLGPPDQIIHLDTFGVMAFKYNGQFSEPGAATTATSVSLDFRGGVCTGVRYGR
jgi:hypothetical protein